MDKEQFIAVMRTVHNALYKLPAFSEKDHIEVMNDLLIVYRSMIAGFHDYLYKSLHTFLLSNPEATDQDFAKLYDMLTIAPEHSDN